jgi:hypothetical protein
MSGTNENDSLAARAATSRDRLQARAASVEPVPAGADASICDRYFQAALAHFQLAELAEDGATFFAQFQAGQAYLQLGQACVEQVTGGER